MQTVSDWVDHIGHQQFAELLGVGSSAVSNMKRANRINAKLYPRVVAICDMAGIASPPMGLFTFVEPEPAFVA